jgi:two-component system, response regulator
LSSSGEQRDIAESYRLGVNSYVQKPVDIVEFRNAIRAMAYYWLGVNRSPFAAPARKTGSSAGTPGSR